MACNSVSIFMLSKIFGDHHWVSGGWVVRRLGSEYITELAVLAFVNRIRRDGVFLCSGILFSKLPKSTSIGSAKVWSFKWLQPPKETTVKSKAFSCNYRVCNLKMSKSWEIWQKRGNSFYLFHEIGRLKNAGFSRDQRAEPKCTCDVLAELGYLQQLTNLEPDF